MTDTRSTATIEPATREPLKFGSIADIMVHRTSTQPRQLRS